MSATLVASGLSKSFGATTVLHDVSVAVGPRSRVGLVGPNGVGKTTLLRILAGLDEPDTGRVTLSPATATVGYLPQERVVEPGETLAAYLARRTGVAAAEAEMEAAAAALAGADAGADATGGRAAEARYSAALERYLALGGPDLDARAAAVCADVGLPADRLDVGLGELSGGQAARAALAAVLLSRFDVLLLDEPTNDLDFAGLARLERFLADLPGAPSDPAPGAARGLVVVSHDRAFLDATVERVLELDEHSRSATEYGGGWQGYLEATAVARRHAEDAYAGYQARRSELTDRARTQRQWAQSGARAVKRKATDHDKAQQGWRVNRTEKQAAKVRITEKALERLEAVEKPWEGWSLDLALDPAARSGRVVARLVDAVVERGTFRLGPVDLEVEWAERVALAGPNGSGKTTLLRALLGDLPLASGERWLGPGVVVGELEQGRGAFLAEESLIGAFTTASGLLPQLARSLLAKFGLSAEHVERPAARLSPGERTRAGLALLMAQGANLLVLDEPTNHLDLPAIEQLEVALEDYPGTLVVVTHDRRLLDALRLTRRVDVTAWVRA